MAVRFADDRRVTHVGSSTTPRRLGPTLPGGRATAGLAALGAAALAIACAVSPARAESGPVVCPFRLATGLPCPGCGLTRAWVFIAHGDFGAALRANPFGYLTMAAAVVLIAVVATAVVRGRPIPSMSPIVRSRPFLVVLACWLAFAAVRIAVVTAG
jgi:Protein of unknown function (DUF2752)